MISEEITRIQQAKEQIRQAIITKGVDVSESVKIDGYAKKILMIEPCDLNNYYEKFQDEDGNTYIINSKGERIITDEKEIPPITNNVRWKDTNGIWHEDYYEDGIIPYEKYADNNNIVEVEIGYGIIEIQDDAFSFCQNLTSIIIPDSVTEIGGWSFADDPNLASVTIGSGLTSIGQYIFDNVPTQGTLICDDDWYRNLSQDDIRNLGNVYYWYNIVGGNVRWMNYDETWHEDFYEDGIVPSKMYQFQPIYELEIKDGIIEIGDYAFFHCQYNKSIKLPRTLKIIGKGAFSENILVNEIEIPNNVTSIGQGAFNNCDALKSIEIPNSVETIGERAFGNCNELFEVIIGSGVTSIDNYAFEYCPKLKEIEIPSSVKTIGNGVFKGCETLGKITIPSSVETIGFSVFENIQSFGTLYLNREWYDNLDYQSKYNISYIMNDSNWTKVWS